MLSNQIPLEKKIWECQNQFQYQPTYHHCIGKSSTYCCCQNAHHRWYPNSLTSPRVPDMTWVLIWDPHHMLWYPPLPQSKIRFVTPVWNLPGTKRLSIWPCNLMKDHVAWDWLWYPIYYFFGIRKKFLVHIGEILFNQVLEGDTQTL